jgi:beta-galactosidase
VFSSVPAQLQGLDFIQTANDDKNALPGNTDFLSFDVDRDVIVYVAHDDRLQRPAWLTSDFADSGLDLSSGGGTYSLFSRSFDAGSVQLGSNVVQPASFSMYSVIVTPANQSDRTAPAAPTGLRVIGD